MFIDKCSASFLFLGVEWVDFGHFWEESFIEFNGVINNTIFPIFPSFFILFYALMPPLWT